MACLFALTMPSGVGIGTWLALGYNPNSPGALVVEGVLDSLSAGILIYTAVNMIKADFGSNIMTSNSRLFITSFCMVLLVLEHFKDNIKINFSSRLILN